MEAEKLKKIQELFDQLYCFNPEQVQVWMKQVFLMKEKGLDELIKALEEGLKEQEVLIKNWIKKVPKFGLELMQIADKNFKTATQHAEKKEKTSAEEVLQEIQ